MVSSRKRVLVTSALPYVNNIPHLGNLVGSVLGADAFSRFKRLEGNEVLFVLGTDEHGTTAEAKAIEEGLTPRQLVDKYFLIHKSVYEWFNASANCLGRSSSKENAEITKHIFLALYKNGYLKEKIITQLYSEKSKKFLSDRFVEGECPLCHAKGARGDQCDSCGNLLDPMDLINPISKIDGSKPVPKETKHLFIDLPKLEPELKKWIDSKRTTWTPLALNITDQWLKQGLRERCITRDLEWGIPVPLDGWEGKVIYSWFDAPIAYIGITMECKEKSWESWWRADDITLYQFMGKDNVPFHSILFPSFLIGTKEKWHLVDYLDSTAYLNYEDKKFSKSKGTGVFGDDAVNSGIASDIWRYYLFRIRPQATDSVFEWSDFFGKVNTELVGNFGNFVNRVISLNEKLFDSVKQESSSTKLIDQVKPLVEEYKELMNKLHLREALMKANEISSVGNKYLQTEEPWIKAKTDKIAAASVISECIDLAKVLAVLYYPFTPNASEKIFVMLGENKTILDVGFENCFNQIPTGTKISKGEILFKKLEEKEIAELKKKFSKE
ncbi:MAG: methionine--tRNA ligase [archaeon]|jgi:methionyl-tRNA synthetase